MAATNEFLAFGTGGGANIITQIAYQILAARSTGFQPGLADAAEANKAWRQSAWVAHCLTQFMANQTGQDVLDDADEGGFIATMATALATASAAIVGSMRNVIGFTSTSLIAQFGGDEIILGTSLAGSTKRIATFGGSLDCSTVGVNGMDTGSIPAAGDLFVYAIYNPTLDLFGFLATVAGAGQTIYPGAHMPAGYTYSALLWAGKTSGSALVNFVQQDRDIYVTPVQPLAAGASTILATIALTNYVPPCARYMHGTIRMQVNAGDGVSQSISIQVSSTNTIGSKPFWIQGGGTQHSCEVDFPLITNQTLYYIWAVRNTGTLDLFLSGYSI